MRKQKNSVENTMPKIAILKTRLKYPVQMSLLIIIIKIVNL